MMRFRLQNIICVGIFSLLFAVTLVQTRLRPSDGCRDKDGVMHDVGMYYRDYNGFSCINVRQVQKEMIHVNAKCEARYIQHPPRDLENVNG